MSDVKRYIVAPDEDGIRLDRWFKIHLPQVTFAYLNKLTRTGQIRVQGGRAKTSTRLQADQELRVPPLMFDTRPADAPKGDVKPLTKVEAELFESMIIFEDKDLYVLNKPPGFAVQGGSKTFQHLDGLLMGMLIEVMALKLNVGNETRAFLTTGILGGFTTFSAYSLDFALLVERKSYGAAFAYGAGSVALSLIAVFAGLYLVRTLAS